MFNFRIQSGHGSPCPLPTPLHDITFGIAQNLTQIGSAG